MFVRQWKEIFLGYTFLLERYILPLCTSNPSTEINIFRTSQTMDEEDKHLVLEELMVTFLFREPNYCSLFVDAL